MTIKIDKTTYNLDLGTTKSETKKKIGDYLVEQIKKDASKGLSSVTGYRWLGLSDKYKAKKRKKTGSEKADLKLLGKMLNKLTYKQRADGIELGIFDSKQATKADGHCNHTGHSSLPPRKFIPSNTLGENFRTGIEKKIAEILREDNAENDD